MYIVGCFFVVSYSSGPSIENGDGGGVVMVVVGPAGAGGSVGRGMESRRTVASAMVAGPSASVESGKRKRA